MKGRIHTLQNEIKAIEDMMDNLSGPMLELALEELQNLQFESDMLSRTTHKSNTALVTEQQLEEQSVHAF